MADKKADDELTMTENAQLLARILHHTSQARIDKVESEIYNLKRKLSANEKKKKTYQLIRSTLNSVPRVEETQEKLSQIDVNAWDKCEDDLSSQVDNIQNRVLGLKSVSPQSAPLPETSSHLMELKTEEENFLKNQSSLLATNEKLNEAKTVLDGLELVSKMAEVARSSSMSHQD